MRHKARRLCGGAPEYYRRRRRVFYAALKYAVRDKQLSANPLDGTPDREWKAPEVDPARWTGAGSPTRPRCGQLLDAISSTGRTQGPRLVALYGCMYYGMLRPSEAVSLLLDECHLPERGLGTAGVPRGAARRPGGNGPTTAKSTRHANPRAARSNAIRRVPIPPELVTLLRKHIDLRHRPGRPPVPYLPGRHLPAVHPLAGAAEGPPAAFTPAQLNSPLIRKPYDFRHAGVSWRLNAGAPGAPGRRVGRAQRRGAATGSTPTASTATTSAGTSGWKTSWLSQARSRHRKRSWRTFCSTAGGPPDTRCPTAWLAAANVL